MDCSIFVLGLAKICAPIVYVSNNGVNTPIETFCWKLHIILVRMICFLLAHDEWSCQNQKSRNWAPYHTFRSRWSWSMQSLSNWSTLQRVHDLISSTASASSQVLVSSLCYRLKVTFLGFKLPVSISFCNRMRIIITI